ncbi:cysteine-rich venom protein latisemin-like [Mya arenaria]|uniref:cysteine-rich venom protein latisemin-like n=1 Tax=Mya arenaria TaxID=6604 RepID=UPI0022E02D08|nr:cysteine-rich venom protein latisemin-like [Mya arenaria]
MKFSRLARILILILECLYGGIRAHTGISAVRNKRQVRCANRFAEITTGHTACLQPSMKVEKSGVTEDEAKSIVHIHNTVRRDVSPQATDMQIMSWDAELATFAQRWAENCVFQHDKNYKRRSFGRFSVGQNLYMHSLRVSWSVAIKAWSDEKADYNYAGASTGVTGHYTQMVWSSSSKVGCGYAYCSSVGNIYVCDYGPAGNMGNQLPYARGTVCSACNGNCNNGLCDCRGRVCMNGGVLDLNTCTCSCNSQLDFYIQPDCALNCTDQQDPRYCTSQWGPGRCEEANIAELCPGMCGWCPYAGANYVERPGGGGQTGGSSRLTATGTLYMLAGLGAVGVTLLWKGRLVI